MTLVQDKPWAAYLNGLIGTYSSSTEAVVALDAFANSNIRQNSYNATFTDIYERWKTTHFQTISEKAQYSYVSAYDKSAELYKIKMRDLKTSHFQSVINVLMNDGKSRSLCSKQKQLFSQLCKYAMNEDLMDKNYAEFCTVPSSPAVKERILSESEIVSIKSMLNDKRLGDTAKRAYVLVYTGMRINELLTVERLNVHLDEHYLVGGEKTEAGRNRVIPIHKEIFPIINDWLNDANENNNDLLLSTLNGLPLDVSGVRKSFNSLMLKLNIEGVSPHTCRHTAATRMIAAGMRIDTVREILGHADCSTTINRYTHTQISSLVDELEKLSPAEL